ncbi:ABC transporter ATP-binding protein [Maritalea mediterranea]|uniref:ABC transporter ATP-binding protein n=1 Tax=Maritalea mediterranea TaxID=2909667 RepID=A0ABS9E947_9HYPH|nr:ABC transporter ATP-binding protein [Maritalea mediterranea]MCF4098280.1 ABC transporter ATP-binding protein [Maritalea mediterranea]
MTQSKLETRPAKSDVNWGPRGTTGISFAAALEFQDVECNVGNSHVLHKTSFETAPGEILCLLGESGSGKSTILRAAAGLQEIDDGRILINKRVMSAKGVTVPPDKRGIGLMFQDFALFPHLSILQNVEYGLKSLGREEARKQALHALKRVGLDRRADDYPSQLSGGQQQRLALARSIAPKPGLLLLDEPFSSLDARLRESVRAETLAVLRETQATCILVTHDPEEAMIFGDKVALLRDGQIAQIGTSDEIYNQPKDLDVARFFSPISEIPTIVHNGVATTPFGNVDAAGRADGTRVIVAMRPIGAVYIDTSGKGTPGRIVAKRDALGVDTLEVAVAGIDNTIRLRQPTNVNIRPGLDVNIAINPEHVLVFDAI